MDNRSAPELLSPNIVRFIDSLPTLTGLDPTKILLPNGKFVTDHLLEHDPDFFNDWRKPRKHKDEAFNINTFIARTTYIAYKLADRGEFQYPGEGPSRPGQNGVGYVYGSKDFSSRRSAASTGNPDAECAEELHGIDASGFFRYLMSMNGIEIGSDMNFELGLNQFNKTIDREYASADKSISVPFSYKPGDILFWKFSRQENIALVGVVIKNQFGNLGALMSYGYGYGDCGSNFSPSPGVNLLHGPRVVSIQSNGRMFQITDPIFWFNSKGEPTLHLNAQYYTRTERSALRIDPDFFGTGSTDVFTFGGGQYCLMEAEAKEIQLTIRDRNTTANLKLTYSEGSSGCSIPAVPKEITYYANVQTDNSGNIDIYFSTNENEAPYANFHGVIEDGVIHGYLYLAKYYSDPSVNWVVSEEFTLLSR